MTSTSPTTGRNVTMTGHRKNCETLCYVYQDFERLAETSADDIVLHPAGRTSTADDVHGLPHVLLHERNLLAATGGTLFMDVQHVSATASFGAVLGMLRAQAPTTVAMPFCGLWRFADGRLVEHWENPYSFADLSRQLAQH
ncbi:nuclear transport factor 2 family protein [Streptomyces sp. NBC_00151]|uniref:nuclear transport factor 2 family protein n=1 Tax=Streptomyces sp. NBC_00151 TaxID=2975669 RepID=UPI002DD93B74|nr:nuclear transport factor 2 family protein [Streptomyces sp. NBC_00151]WRZ36751.1 nuclear transport factor 2 family protein [Streptomyces sp. NBC_00151]WRZ44826.1 nuclear transport factor 2 family protein [Streptomyces sp. NBC_00151]